VQRYLNFLDIPIPETHVWEESKNEQRTLVIETLARLIAKAALANKNQEEQNHD
jgi:hypothetical protein